MSKQCPVAMPTELPALGRGQPPFKVMTIGEPYTDDEGGPWFIEYVTTDERIDKGYRRWRAFYDPLAKEWYPDEA